MLVQIETHGRDAAAVRTGVVIGWGCDRQVEVETRLFCQTVSGLRFGFRASGVSAVSILTTGSTVRQQWRSLGQERTILIEFLASVCGCANQDRKLDAKVLGSLQSSSDVRFKLALLLLWGKRHEDYRSSCRSAMDVARSRVQVVLPERIGRRRRRFLEQALGLRASDTVEGEFHRASTENQQEGRQ